MELEENQKMTPGNLADQLDKMINLEKNVTTLNQELQTGRKDC